MHENSKKFVAVLNKKIEIGKLMNALGHMTAGLAGGFGRGHEMEFLEYKDANGGIHPHISNFPFIVLKVDNSNQVRKIRNEALACGIICTDFTDTMTLGTSAQQIESTATKQESELEYFGVCMFGDTAIIDTFTSKLSLFK